ncbi:hypothetical protein [Saccharopolyspora taberi]|uniref:Uncharacterized protein n=1 Tax=Saccharopolyspora taberi TaxID=60895 RepID=A0ABN3VM50_9PSEU
MFTLAYALALGLSAVQESAFSWQLFLFATQLFLTGTVEPRPARPGT